MPGTVRTYGGAGQGLAYAWNGAEIGRQAEEYVAAVCDTLSDRALAYMRTIVPVDTGFLRDSTFVEVLRSGITATVVVGAGAGYALFVELGTTYTEAQPFIRPAFDWLVSQLPAVLRAEAAARGWG